MKKSTKNSLLLLLGSVIWGLAFVAQSSGGDEIGAFSFNCIRSFIGVLALIPAIAIFEKKGILQKPETKEEKKINIKAGIECGIALCLASNLQQLGINLGDSTGKAGFLTAIYILLVPIIGLIFLKKKCGKQVWIGVLIALAGLYLLCINGKLSFSASDLYLLGCAFVFSIQILLVDYWSPKVESLRLCCYEFVTTGVISLIPMFIFEVGKGQGGFNVWLSNFGSLSVWVSLLYAGVLSCGVAYSLQIIGQKGVEPAIASLLMSFESVFSLIGGFLILHQKMSARQLVGCLLIFIAVLVAQKES